MNNSLVSIVIPTHNRASLLSRALMSVLNQSYRNWEAIIISDHCTDKTKEVLEKYGNDLRIQNVQLKRNVGGAEARNIGMKLAKGEYISFLDDDDEWHPRKLEYQVKVFKRNIKVCIVGCNCQVKTKYGTYQSYFFKNVNLDRMLYRNGMGSFSFCMTRKKYIEGVFIEKELKACQDWDLWLKIFQKTGLNGLVLPGIYVYRDISHNLPRLTTTFKDANEAHWKFFLRSKHLMNSRHIAYRKAIYFSRLNSVTPKYRFYMKSIGYLALSLNKANLREALFILYPNWFFGIDINEFVKKLGVLLKRKIN